MDDKKFVDPLTLKESELPIICLSDDRVGFFGWGIKAHEKGNYNHAFILHRQWFAASQGFGLFKEIRTDVFMTPRQILKFWKIRDLTEAEKNGIIRAVTRRIALPWYKRTYDWIGVFGQLLKLNFIQNPLQTFCSEEVRIDYISQIPRASKVTPNQPSPADLNRVFRANPDIFECVGYYWQD